MQTSISIGNSIASQIPPEADARRSNHFAAKSAEAGWSADFAARKRPIFRIIGCSTLGVAQPDPSNGIDDQLLI
jgi:hypothetical protein